MKLTLIKISSPYVKATIRDVYEARWGQRWLLRSPFHSPSPPSSTHGLGLRFSVGNS